MKKFAAVLFFSAILVSQAWTKEYAKIYLGSELRFDPGQGKNTGFGEFHWGWKTDVFNVTGVAGFSSKAFLSSVQLKNPDVIKVLDSLVQSETEAYFGAIFDGIFYRYVREPDRQIGEAPKMVVHSGSPLVEGPDVKPGWGVGGRLEIVANAVNKKAENDPAFYRVGGTYLNAYFASDILAIWPMIGIGFNEGLDRYFVVEEAPNKRVLFSPRLKLRIDIISRRSLFIAGTNAQIFLSFQREWPFEEEGTIKLEDGTLAPAKKLADSSLRLGISFDL